MREEQTSKSAFETSAIEINEMENSWNLERSIQNSSRMLAKTGQSSEILVMLIEEYVSNAWQWILLSKIVIIAHNNASICECKGLSKTPSTEKSNKLPCVQIHPNLDVGSELS